MKKKIKFLIVILIIILISVFFTTRHIFGDYYTDESNNGIKWSYQVSDGVAKQVYIYSNVYNLKNITELNIPSSMDGYDVISLGTNNASIVASSYNLEYVKNIEKIVIPDTVTEIGENYFKGFSSLKEINISQNLEQIKSNVFANTGLEGRIEIPSSVKTIESGAFSGTEVTGIIISGDITLNENSIPNLTDIYLTNGTEKVTIENNWLNPTYHNPDCTHNITINVPEGIKIIDTITGNQITNGEYPCMTNLKLKYEIQEGYSYNSLISTISNKIVDLSNEYEIDITKDIEIDIYNMSQKAELTLRQYISKINYSNLEEVREPTVNVKSTGIEYLHTKQPVEIKEGDIITYNIRIYNEGLEDGTVLEVSEFLPEGIDFLENNNVNKKYNWVVSEDGRKITSDYLKNYPVKGYVMSNDNLSYVEIPIICKVTKKTNSGEDLRFVNIAEISSASIQTDGISHGNIVAGVDSNYKNDEAINSNSNSYIQGNEKDDDFENVIEKAGMKVDYALRIKKTDSDTSELLAGAKFELLNEDKEKIREAITNEEGILDFGILSTYGEGKDCYYIREVSAPEGYTVYEKSTIKVDVTKTIIDEQTGEYSIKVECDELDFEVDTTRYEYIPVYTKEQLSKIGSGETINIDGTNYIYNLNSNYKLMNDIDLGEEEWVPIPYEVEGIINGDGHKISNLTITNSDEMQISEIGLFRSFSGIIDGITLENVNIDIQTIAEDAETLSGHPCVGGFVGFMREGTIKNCTVSGNISAITDNIGGFVGHSQEEHIVKFQNCTNMANVKGGEKTVDLLETIEITSSNVGGLIGCSLGALSITDCTNMGEIECSKYNAGGLVGYVKSTDYNESEINADFNEEDKIITIVIKNKRTSGKYYIELENVDAKTLGIIEGAKYVIYDRDKNVIPGCEEVELSEGKLRVASIDIETLGIDTYYIKEIEPVGGYKRLNDSIKIEVTREWDKENESYTVSVNAHILSDEEVQEDIPLEENNSVPSQTGEIFSKVDFENVSWNINKVEILNSENSGEIATTYMNAGGLIGTAHCSVTIENSNNTGDISASAIGYYGKAGGLIAEVKRQSEKDIANINNCINEGDIIGSKGNYGSSGGLIGESVMNTNMNDCKNSGKIEAGTSAGMIANYNGKLCINRCINEGEILAISSTESANTYCIAAGIVAKNNNAYWYSEMTKEENSIVIKDCMNLSNIQSSCHIGGIVAYSTADIIDISDCIIKNCSLNGVSSDKGGVIGFTSARTIQIKNCNVENVKLDQEKASYYYGSTGGIIGFVGDYSDNIESVEVLECNVINSEIYSMGKETGGIVGHIDASNTGTIHIYIDYCNVSNSEIVNSEIENSGRGSSAGILGSVYGTATSGSANIEIYNCDVNTSKIEANSQSVQTNLGLNAGGITGMLAFIEGLNVQNCQVGNNTSIICNSNENDANANCGGIISYVMPNQKNAGNIYNISECTVDDTSLNTQSGNLSGIIAGFFDLYRSDDNNINLSNCNVSKSSIYSESEYNSNSITAGIIGWAGNPVNITNCNVKENTTIYGRGRDVAGIVGLAYTGATITDSYVTDVDINSDGGKYLNTSSTCYDNVAGIIGYAYGTINITDSTVKRTSINGYVSNASGIVGAVIGSEQNIIENVIVEDTNIENTLSDAAGIIVYSDNDIKLRNCYVRKSESNTDEMNIKVNNGTVSGMIGVARANIDIADCSVSDVNIINETGDLVSGMMGSIIYNNLIMEKCSANNIYLKGDSSQAGGLIGAIIYKDQVIVSDCNMQNIEINAKGSVLGGMIGIIINVDNMAIKDVVIGNLNINEENLDESATMSNYAGGLIGQMKNVENSIISNCNVNDSNISNSIGAGGIIGIVCDSAEQMTIEKCSINKIDLSSSAEGCAGLIGYISSDMSVNVSDCLVENSTITGSGMIGNAGSTPNGSKEITMSNNKVENVKLICSNNIGGMIGTVSGILIVENSNIKDIYINNNNR